MIDSNSGFLIGITGNSGCGQTTAAEYISEECSGICSLDLVGHRLLDRRYVISELADSFSRTEFNHMDGESIRIELRKMVLNDTKAYAILNSVLHPRMIRWAVNSARILRKLKGIWVLEGALICELEIHKMLDYLIVIHDSEYRSVSRVAARDNISLKDAAKRWEVQLPIENKSIMADEVVNNSGELDNMKQQILTIFQCIKKNMLN
ncbi:MAG: dephospho-CoA kinase [Candidatus Aegiribacteria sp.]|nr:dephospho-CoA kinase [Candidatus Aegiribacteria sp.]